MRVFQKGHPEALFYFSLLSAILLYVGNLSTYFFLKDWKYFTAFVDGLTVVNSLFVAIAFFVLSCTYKGKSPRLVFAWRMIAIGQFFYMTGDLSWAILTDVLKQSPFPSIADYLYLLYYPFFLFGIIILSEERSSVMGQIKRSIDLTIVMLCASLFFWNFVMGPIAASTGDSGWEVKVLSVAYPAADMVLFYALLVLFTRNLKSLNPMTTFLLSFGIISVIFADIVFSFQTIAGTYSAGGTADIGFITSELIMGLSAVVQIYSNRTGIEHYQQAWHRFSLPDRFPSIFQIIPYFWFAGAFGLLVTRHFYDLPMSYFELSVGVSIVITLVLLRQAIGFAENRRLVNELQGVMLHAQNQSTELVEINRKLQVEISERFRAEEQLMHDAMHDTLTGLPNRALFLDRLTQAIERTKRRPDYPFSVLFLDLDSFKVVNDSLGHTIGDTLLVSIARRLKETVRAGDTVARLGGDEFVILCENATEDQAVEIIARHIQEQIRRPFLLNGHSVFTTASIGIVQNLNSYISSQEVLRDADIAMYKAKSMGKARHEIFSENLRSQVITRLEVEDELRQAMDRKELAVFYQPIVSIISGELTGFEALVRWKHPQRGLVLPKDFLQVAEESGLIIPMGHWILRDACRQMVNWQSLSEKMKNLSINVNISGKQFSDPKLIDDIQSALLETGLPAGTLKLEITETVLIDNQGVAAQIFNRLVSLGVQLQIDDFGTGYSSLSYLQNYPIHTIKIDKSFVQRIGDGGKSTELIRAIVSMAREMGMDTIAEGIETNEQFSEIQSLMCKYGQGFLLASPMDRESTENYLREFGAVDARAVSG